MVAITNSRYGVAGLGIGLHPLATYVSNCTVITSVANTGAIIRPKPRTRGFLNNHISRGYIEPTSGKLARRLLRSNLSDPT